MPEGVKNAGKNDNRFERRLDIVYRIHSCGIRSFVRSLARSFIRSFVRSFVCLFVLSFVYSFVRSFVRLFIHSFLKKVSFTDKLIKISLACFL